MKGFLNLLDFYWGMLSGSGVGTVYYTVTIPSRGSPILSNGSF